MSLLPSSHLPPRLPCPRRLHGEDYRRHLGQRPMGPINDTGANVAATGGRQKRAKDGYLFGRLGYGNVMDWHFVRIDGEDPPSNT